MCFGPCRMSEEHHQEIGNCLDDSVEFGSWDPLGHDFVPIMARMTLKRFGVVEGVIGDQSLDRLKTITWDWNLLKRTHSYPALDPG